LDEHWVGNDAEIWGQNNYSFLRHHFSELQGYEVSVFLLGPPDAEDEDATFRRNFG
jgi:hypothetical protein